MTKLLDRALQAVRELPADMQHDTARIVLELAGTDAGSVALSAEERAAIDRSKAAADRGEFAADEQLHAAVRRAARNPSTMPGAR